ncbi:hypothetical protein ANACOL_01836 [Anaerotruncus colihominis DSM 17241]|uniref:Uncharacterized protein n=1 Tax=Anaerotruncus colihominis DSM 17241 TaxID=445972 RepID=B0PAN6_9FIRM|nr:hypothetical protein ANACOL_01836 [Anaerotruncus colihominis DSM 17241]
MKRGGDCGGQKRFLRFDENYPCGACLPFIAPNSSEFPNAGRIGMTKTHIIETDDNRDI